MKLRLTRISCFPVFFLLAACSSSNAVSTDSRAALDTMPAEQKLVAGWVCVSGACPDEEIEFAIEDGKRVFRSWLHHRPAMFGTWEVQGRNVKVVVGSDLIYDWRVIRVDRKRLVMQEVEEKEQAVFRRVD